MMGFSYLAPQRIRKPEPSYEAAHTPSTLPQTRLADHKQFYVKPRPANYWDWHCPVCNAPLLDKP
jgi:hypothetical protein